MTWISQLLRRFRQPFAKFLIFRGHRELHTRGQRRKKSTASLNCMKTLVQQVQEILNRADQHVQVVEIRPVSSANNDQRDFRKEQAGTVVSSEEVRVV
jgi:DNA-binding winged helix-turn-helix (wHTH) protein